MKLNHHVSFTFGSIIAVVLSPINQMLGAKPIRLSSCFVCVCVQLLCNSCGRAKSASLTSANEQSKQESTNQTLMSGRLTIVGEANTGGWPKGIVTSVYGAHNSMIAGEQEIGLMHLLIFPPKDGKWFRRTDTGPNIMRFEWHPSSNQTVLLQILYDPEKHDIAILDNHYSLDRGNFFVITVQNRNRIQVRQLSVRNFDYKTPGDALRTFKRECKDLTQVQEM